MKCRVKIGNKMVDALILEENTHTVWVELDNGDRVKLHKIKNCIVKGEE